MNGVQNFLKPHCRCGIGSTLIGEKISRMIVLVCSTTVTNLSFDHNCSVILSLSYRSRLKYPNSAKCNFYLSSKVSQYLYKVRRSKCEGIYEGLC